MACSLFQVEGIQKDCCVVYLHSLHGNRQEAMSIQAVVEQEFDLCCFDFIGSGQSEGTFCTFGAREYIDLKYILARLSDQLEYKSFVLWGRSTGAATVVNYLALTLHGPKIEAIVLDSPYSNTKDYVHNTDEDVCPSFSRRK